MRYFIIEPGEGDIGPWVLAESPDEAWTRDNARTWRDAVVLSEEEALLDPDLASVVVAWKAGDDRAYAAWAAIEEMEMAADNAVSELAIEGVDVEDFGLPEVRVEDPPFELTMRGYLDQPPAEWVDDLDERDKLVSAKAKCRGLLFALGGKVQDGLGKQTWAEIVRWLVLDLASEARYYVRRGLIQPMA